MTDEPWFEPKSHGYGAGRPRHWKGWALLAAYLAGPLALLFAARALMALYGVPSDAAMGILVPAWLLFVMLPATLVLVRVAKARTRGGWRWRWGREDGPHARAPRQ